MFLKLEEETKNLSSQMLLSGLLVVHDSAGCSHNNISKLSGRQKVVSPLLEISDTNVESEIILH